METNQTAARAFELLDYNPEEGTFVWKKNRRGRRQAGHAAGCVHPNGYVRISIDYRLYNAHRLAWLFMSGAWPLAMIDHIDGNPSNNKFVNLREANCVQNGSNRKISKSNTSGIKGVSFIKSVKKWGAWIKVDGKSKNIGSFHSKEEAGEAYRDAAIKLHKDFARLK